MNEMEWEPGEPLYRPTAFQLQPMIGLKNDSTFLATRAARWSPDKGWRSDEDL